MKSHIKREPLAAAPRRFLRGKPVFPAGKVHGHSEPLRIGHIEAWPCALTDQIDLRQPGIGFVLFIKRGVAAGRCLTVPLRLLCREGCQKCGVFCVLASICDQLKNEHEVDVCRCVERARTSRPEFITNAQNIATQLTRDACALSREADEELRRQSREERPG
ncbi:uncharacterized protein LOC144110183 [Amblyomma americanum]